MQTSAQGYARVCPHWLPLSDVKTSAAQYSKCASVSRYGLSSLKSAALLKVALTGLHDRSTLTGELRRKLQGQRCTRSTHLLKLPLAALLGQV